MSKLKNFIQNGTIIDLDHKVFVITEDIVTVSTDDTKGVAPYNTSYGYTNIDIDANAGIKWVEGAIYSFVIDTEMAVASAYRNVRVRIGNGNYIPMKSRNNTILSGSSYMSKSRTQFFVYKTVYETGGALHMTTDTSYSAMSVSEGKTGTATTARTLRADYLKKIIEYHAGNLDASKANDNAVVKLTGNQTIAGTKTFSTSPVVPSKTSAATNTGTAIATEAQVYLKANTSDVLTKTNTTSFTPSANYHPATKKYVDDTVAGKVSDTAYSASWDGVTSVAPSKNAVYDHFLEIQPTVMTASQYSQVSSPVAGKIYFIKES